MCKSYDDYGTPGFEQWLTEFDFEDNDIPDDVGEAILAFDQIWTAIERELFVTSRPIPPELPSDDRQEDMEPNELEEWVEWSNILSLVQLGFSMDDIKHMPMSDFIAYTDIMAASAPKQDDEPEIIEADQGIIDSFFF